MGIITKDLWTAQIKRLSPTTINWLNQDRLEFYFHCYTFTFHHGTCCCKTLAAVRYMNCMIKFWFLTLTTLLSENNLYTIQINLASLCTKHLPDIDVQSNCFKVLYMHAIWICDNMDYTCMYLVWCGSSIGSVSAWHTSSPRVRHSFVETWSWKSFYGHSPSCTDSSEQLSVTGERMCNKCL